MSWMIRRIALVAWISVRNAEDTRAIGRIELYSKHEEPQSGARRARAKIHKCGLPRPLAG
jgi:hypothetical protein